MALGMTADSTSAAQSAAGDTPLKVFMDQDGLGLSPIQVLAELSSLAAQQPVAVDQYGLGGHVEEVEKYFAQVLGKPHALFMPSGTLANQLALRVLAGDQRRVLVQDLSHVYNDTGDACQTLAGLTLLPLASGRATFTLGDVEAAVTRTYSGRVLTTVGAISVESPVRRAFGELFDWQEALRICDWARNMGIRTHLDGARLFIASAYTGVSVADYAKPFDMVYVSLWKYFNCLNGAVLAFSDRTQVERLRALRRMHGGALFSVWPFAMLARHYAEGFVERFRRAIAISEAFMASMSSSGAQVERIEHGTNLFKLLVPQQTAIALRRRLLDAGVVLPQPGLMPGGRFGYLLHVNESWNITSGATLAEKFQTALR